jgi:hypothetical protein
VAYELAGRGPSNGRRVERGRSLNKLGDVRRAQRGYALAGPLFEESLRRLEGQGDELRAVCCTIWATWRSPRSTIADPLRSSASA